ncbi:NAD-dependent epimerase/dehydratase family protein [Thermodesulfobacteriota bacterium]
MNKQDKPQRVLVTGGGGFLGSGIAQRLIARGDRVRSLSRGFYPKLQALGVEQVQGDISESSAVQQACQGVDLVFHTAAKAGIWGAYDDYYRTNVVGTRNVIKACQQLNISRLVYTSTPSVVFNGKDMAGVDESVPYSKKFDAPYPQTKAQAEQEILSAASHKLKTIALRPHLIWGPEDNHLVPRILARAHRLKQVGDGKNLIDTIYIDNAVDAHLLAADALENRPDIAGRVYFISNNEPMPLWEIVNRILDAGGLPPVRRSIHKSMALAVGSALEFTYKMFHISAEPQMTRFVAQELSTTHWFNIQAAQRDLGYHPQVTMEQGFDRLKQWLKTIGKAPN